MQLTEQEKQRRLEEIQRQKVLQEQVAPVVVKPKPVKPPTPKPVAPSVPPEPVLAAEVEVKPGETLSDVAARREVYGDALLWPLVYKANRDQIKNPQQIFPGQILMISRDKSAEEKESAREEARNSELFQ